MHKSLPAAIHKPATVLHEKVMRRRGRCGVAVRTYCISKPNLYFCIKFFSSSFDQTARINDTDHKGAHFRHQNNDASKLVANVVALRACWSLDVYDVTYSIRHLKSFRCSPVKICDHHLSQASL